MVICSAHPVFPRFISFFQDISLIFSKPHNFSSIVKGIPGRVEILNQDNLKGNIKGDTVKVAEFPKLALILGENLRALKYSPLE